MIELYLDDQRLEIPEDTSIGLSVGIANIEDPISASASYSQTIQVPITPHNTKVFKHTEHILSVEMFNHSEHTAAIYEDGVELIKGKAYLDGVTDTDYNIQIIGNEFGWLERIRDKKLNEIDDETVSAFNAYLTLTDEQRKSIFFGLLDHGCWWQTVGDSTMRRKWATYADLVPFIGLTTILRAIFKGYTINYGSVAGLLTRLYVTGQWAKPDNADVLAEDNSFRLSCAGNNVEEAELNGEKTIVVGGKLSGKDIKWANVFDTVEEAANGCIIMEEETKIVDGEEASHYVPLYEPTDAMDVSFKIRLKYATSMSYLRNAQTYAFADTIYLTAGYNEIAKLSLDDGIKAIESAEALNEGLFREARLTDKPAELEVKESEKADFYIRLSDYSMYTEVVQITWQTYPTAVYKSNKTIATITGNEVCFRAACNFSLNTNYTVDSSVNAAIGLKTKYGDIVIIGDAEQAYEMLDYTLKYKVLKRECRYADEIRMTSVQLYNLADVGSITFDANILTTGINISSSGTSLSVGFSSSKGIGETDIVVNVLEAEIEPVFNFSKCWGDPISLNDVGGDATATDMLKAIMQLFNLRIYANTDTKEVNIIPYSDFYTNNVIDWRDRIDQDKGVEIITIGDNIGKSFRVAYAENNDVIAERNKRQKEPYMSYKTQLLTKRSNEDYELVNSIFNPPTMDNVRRIFPSTISAYPILQLAKDEQGTQDNLDINSLPRTVVMLRKNEFSTNDEATVNLVYATDGVFIGYMQPEFTTVNQMAKETISFSDADGVKGLHKYYDKQVEAWNYGKRITCYCKLYPQEVASLRKAGSSIVDFRSKFLINIDGNDVYCRLESIENYEPLNATHKCTFLIF